PTEAVVEREVGPNLPGVLPKEGDVFVGDVREAGSVCRRPGQSCALQVKEERTAGCCPAGTSGRRGHERSVRAADSVWSETSRSRRRSVTQETADAVEDVAPVKESTKHLIVQRVQPFAADFDRVIAGDDREIVLYLRAPESLVDVRRQEERKAKPERRVEAHRGVSRNVRRNRRTWAQLARVREVRFIQLRRRKRAEQVRANDVDLRRSFDAVRRIAVSGNVEGLVCVLRIVEVVRDVELVRVVQFETALREERLVIDLVFYRQALFLVARGAEEIDQREPLAVCAAVDERFVGDDRRRSDRARRADRFAEI